MRHNIILFGLVLIVLSSQLGSAQALSSCNGIWIDAEDLTVERNDTEYFYFPIHNEEDEDFDIFGIQVWREDGEFEIALEDYPTTIKPDQEKELTIRIETGALDEESLGSAYIIVRGTFDDEKYCGYGSIGETHFDVTVEVDEEEVEPGCRDVEIRARDVSVSENSTRIFTFQIENHSDKRFELYDIALDESNSYLNAEVYSKPGTIARNDEASFRVKIEAETVSRDRETDVEITARGRFSDGEYCSYSRIDTEEFTVSIDNSTGTGSDPEPDDWEKCDNVYVNAGTVTVEKGKTAYETIFIENSAGENFLVDYASIFDLSPNLKAEEAGYAKVVPAFGNSSINAKVRAYDYAEIGRDEAFVEVRGHFQNGESCSISGQGLSSFLINIKESKPETTIIGSAGFAANNEPVCSLVSLSVPASKDIGKSGTVPIVIDNRSMERINVRLSGPGITVEPQLISIPKKTLVNENVSVSSALSETTLVYSIESGNCNTTKSTRITADTGEKNQEENQAQGDVKEVLEALSTGFIVLGQTGAALGIFVIAAIIAYLILRH